MLQSDLCDYSDVYFFVNGTITVSDPIDVNYNNKFRLCENGSR